MIYVVVQETDLDTMYGLCQWMEGYRHVQNNIFEVASKELLPRSARIISSRNIEFQQLANSICQSLGSEWQIFNTGSISILEHCKGYSLVLGISNGNSEKWTLHVKVNRRLSTDTNKDTNSIGWIGLPELVKYDVYKTFIFSRHRKVESITKCINKKILPNYICCYQAGVIAHKEKMTRFANLVIEGNKLASIINANVSSRGKADINFRQEDEAAVNNASGCLELHRYRESGELTFKNLSIEQMKVLLETYKQITK